MTPPERREAARLRSERWRRAWHHAETPGATPVAGGRYQPKHMASAAQASTGAGSIGGQDLAKPGDV